jgi:hypothetical protein
VDETLAEPLGSLHGLSDALGQRAVGRVVVDGGPVPEAHVVLALVQPDEDT